MSSGSKEPSRWMCISALGSLRIRLSSMSYDPTASRRNRLTHDVTIDTFCIDRHCGKDGPMAAPQRPGVGELLRYFLYLGSLGFGGPVALVGYMQRDLVERRAWFTKEEYMKCLALSQLAPGPLAAQLAICLGFVHSRVRGATLVAFAFVLPSS